MDRLRTKIREQLRANKTMPERKAVLYVDLECTDALLAPVTPIAKLATFDLNAPLKTVR